MKLKKMLCTVLSLVMVMGTMSFTAFAEETEATAVSTLAELQSAIDAGEDVKLVADITYSGVYNAGQSVKVPASRSAASVDVTLDLNGFTLAQTTTNSGGLSAAAVVIRPGSTLTVTDTSAEADGKISACNCAFQNEGTLNIEAGSIVIGEVASAADKSAEMGFAYGVWMYMASESAEAPAVNMTGGSISMVDNGYVADYVSAVCADAGVDGVADCYKDMVVNIAGGAIEGNVVVHADATNVTVPAGTDVVYYGKVEEAGATEVGTYDELQAALDAGEDVKLVADITYSGVYNAGKTIKVPSSRSAASVDVTLDLNGFTLAQTTTNSGGLSAAAIAIRPGSTLTVTDTSAEADGKISACNCAFQNEGTVNVAGGSIVIGEVCSGADKSEESGFAYGVWMYMVSETAAVPAFNMTGGSISMVDNGYAADYVSAVCANDGVDGVADCYKDMVVNITGGTIEGNVVVHADATNVTVPAGTDVIYYGKVEEVVVPEVLTRVRYYRNYMPITLYPENASIYRLGLYAAAQSADYDEYGFEVTVEGQEPILVKAEKYGVALNIVVGDSVDKFVASDFNTNGANNVCIFGQTVAFKASALGNDKVTYRPYVKVDGNTYYGEATTAPNIYTK